MLVGRSDLSIVELELNAKDLETFKAYCDSLVPVEFRHITGIISNQRYICLLALRGCKNIAWDKKKEIIDGLMLSINIIGYTNELIDLNTMLTLTNKDRLMKFRKKELEG